MKRARPKRRRSGGTQRAATAVDVDDVDLEPAETQNRSPLNDDQRQSLARRRLERYLESKHLEICLRDVFDES